jgi:protein-S-isoprenylcysteine O-methyltransferase Ste14
MESARKDFFFRNRRWFLLGLIVLVVFSTSFISVPVFERVAPFLAAHFPRTSLALWNHLAIGVSAALVALGAFWRTWGTSYLTTSVVQDRQMHTDRLLADGPYRYSRNPLYFGNILFSIGIGVLLGPIASLVLIVGMWILVRLFIRDEEAGLEETKGEPYRAYRAAVPRLFPSFRARVASAGARPRWLQGFCGEAFLWALAVADAGMAITLDPAWLHRRVLFVFAVALVLYLWACSSTRKPAASSPV